MLTVFEPGCTVLVGSNVAQVIAVTLNLNGHVQYRVVYWKGQDRCDVWVETVEVLSDDSSVRTTIGFVPPGG